MKVVLTADSCNCVGSCNNRTIYFFPTVQDHECFGHIHRKYNFQNIEANN